MVILASWLPPSPGTLLGVLVLTGWAWNASHTISDDDL